MNTLDIATWLAIAGALLAVVGIFFALATYRNARRFRQNLPETEFDTAIHVVVVVPKEERRYFVSVPPGLQSWEIVQSVSKALEEAAMEKAQTEPPAHPGSPNPLAPRPRPELD
jgi:hypothetical protein